MHLTWHMSHGKTQKACFLPVLGRDPAVPTLVPVNGLWTKSSISAKHRPAAFFAPGLTPVPGRIFCLAFSSAIACTWRASMAVSKSFRTRLELSQRGLGNLGCLA